MRILKGIAASSGIGIGKALLYMHEKPVVPHGEIDPISVKGELERFHAALLEVGSELHHLAQDAVSDHQRLIIETHQMMLQDPEFIASVEKLVSVDFKCIEWAVESVLSSLISTLEQSPDQMFRERSADLYDVGWRLIRNLLGKARPQLSDLHEPVVLVADALLPSEALLLKPSIVKAIALDGGGRTSHVAILARAFQIPTVVGLGTITSKVSTGDDIIVDGNHGEVAVRPSAASAVKMQQRFQRWVEHERELQDLTNLEAVTTDGHAVFLKANIETLEEVEAVIGHGASGVGLYRSEFLFLKPGGATEDEQFSAYRSVLERMSHVGPVTIRTMDVGGDKMIPGMDGFGEENPILGWRAVRFCLSRKDIFRIQLRALLRASVYGKLKIMFPMISGIEEFAHVLAFFEQVKDECRQAHIQFDEAVEVGTMIEVPSAALCADLLAKKADFFSIGTNDLIQYTIAVDRGNDKIAYLYQPFHPGVLRLVKQIVDKGHEAGIPVGMCGEMAGDPLCSVLLLGLGLDEFSMSPQSLLEIKSIVRRVSYSEARDFANKVMSMDSYVEITSYAREWMHDRFGNSTFA